MCSVYIKNCRNILMYDAMEGVLKNIPAGVSVENYFSADIKTYGRTSEPPQP